MISVSILCDIVTPNWWDFPHFTWKWPQLKHTFIGTLFQFISTYENWQIFQIFFSWMFPFPCQCVLLDDLNHLFHSVYIHWDQTKTHPNWRHESLPSLCVIFGCCCKSPPKYISYCQAYLKFWQHFWQTVPFKNSYQIHEKVWITSVKSWVMVGSFTDCQVLGLYN